MVEAFDSAASSVRSLIAHSKSKLALDRAKDVHKQFRSADSEKLLCEAYKSRISDLLRENMEVEALALISLVRERYPSYSAELQEIEWAASVSQGKMDCLAALADPELSAARRDLLHRLIRQSAAPQAIAACAGLPEGHPVRTAAAAISNAFQLVTSRATVEDELRLSEVSHRSPLAPWKMLILAISAMYRREDDTSRRYLERIDPDSAPYRLKPAVEAILRGTAEPGSPRELVHLLCLAKGDGEEVRVEANRVAQAVAAYKPGKKLGNLGDSIRKVVLAARQISAPFSVLLRNHFMVRLLMAGARSNQLGAAFGKEAVSDPGYVRLCALLYELPGKGQDWIAAAAAWATFFGNPEVRKTFPDEREAGGVLALHMARMLARLPEDYLADAREGFIENGLDQDPWFLDPRRLFERSCVDDPRSESFSEWLAWEKRHQHYRRADEAAEAWTVTLPRDVEPLLHLADSAERRNSLQKALGFISRAEALDRFAPEVRRARARLLFGAVTKQLVPGKGKAAAKHLAAMEESEFCNQGDRRALVPALRYGIENMAGNEQAKAECLKQVAAILDPAAAMALAYNIVFCSKTITPFDTNLLPVTSEERVLGAARVCVLGSELGVPFAVPHGWRDDVTRLVASKSMRLDTQSLIALGEQLVRNHLFKPAFAVSNAGLAAGNADARFLFIRSRALPPHQRNRANQMQAAAATLANRNQDLKLLNEIIHYRRAFGSGLPRWMGEEDLKASDLTVSDRHLAALLEAERQLTGYPDSSPMPKYVDEFERSCDCSACRAGREPLPDPFPGDDDFDDDGDFDDPDIPDDPEEVLRALFELLGNMSPKEAEKALKQASAQTGVHLPGVTPRKGRGGRRGGGTPF